MSKEFIFTSKPREIKAVQFLGDDMSYDWLKVLGTKLPKEERVAEFFNSLHDTYIEAKYGDWIVITDLNDLYPIKDDVLRKHYIIKGPSDE